MTNKKIVTFSIFQFIIKTVLCQISNNDIFHRVNKFNRNFHYCYEIVLTMTSFSQLTSCLSAAVCVFFHGASRSRW